MPLFNMYLIFSLFKIESDFESKLTMILPCGWAYSCEIAVTLLFVFVYNPVFKIKTDTCKIC